LLGRCDGFFQRRFGGRIATPEKPPGRQRPSVATLVIGAIVVTAAGYLGVRAAGMLSTLSPDTWRLIAVSVLATLLRVCVALGIALAWTIPVGVLIGTNRRMANILQPVVQIVAAVPATALFPVMLLVLISLPAGLNMAAVLLMLMGTQWYLLFNVIAGAAAIPQDLRYTTDLLRMHRVDRWRTLVLPSLFPFIITGAITASGGAWNASIVAESVEFGGQTYQVVGIGSLIARATASGNYALLLASTLALVGTVVVINRTFWLRLYRLAEERYRME
jgi:NitT/TauT family transport system permease protein